MKLVGQLNGIQIFSDPSILPGIVYIIGDNVDVRDQVARVLDASIKIGKKRKEIEKDENTETT